MIGLIILNLLVFCWCLIFFNVVDDIKFKIFWAMVFIIYTYFNITNFYPRTLEIEKQRKISQEKLKDCDIIKPDDRIVVYRCPDFTTTNVKVRYLKHTETYSNTISNK